MKTYELKYIETCLSDYFSGYGKPVIQVPVDGNTTVEQVKDYLLSYWATEHIEELETESYEKAVLEYMTDICTYAVGKVLSLEDIGKVMAKKWDSTLPIYETEEDYDEGEIYSYFALVEIEEEEN
jgi:nucleoid-associated protein YejK